MDGSAAWLWGAAMLGPYPINALESQLRTGVAARTAAGNQLYRLAEAFSVRWPQDRIPQNS